MAQAFSRRPVAVRTPFRSKDSPCEFSGVQGGTARIFFFYVFRSFPVTAIPPMLHSRLYLRVAVTRRTNGGNPGNPPENYTVSEVGALWIENFLVSKGLNSVTRGCKSAFVVCVCVFVLQID